MEEVHLRQQYLRALVKLVTPGIKMVTVNRGSLCTTIQLENVADVDKYVAQIREKLVGMLEDNDVVHII